MGSRGKYESIAGFPTTLSQKALRKLQGGIQDNKEDHSNLDSAVYHEQFIQWTINDIKDPRDLVT